MQVGDRPSKNTVMISFGIVVILINSWILLREDLIYHFTVLGLALATLGMAFTQFKNENRFVFYILLFASVLTFTTSWQSYQLYQEIINSI